MPSLFHRTSDQSTSKVTSNEQTPSTTSLNATTSGSTPSTSRPTTPSGSQKSKSRLKFWSSRPKSALGQTSPPAGDATQQDKLDEVSVPPQSLIVAPMEVPFKGSPEDRAHEIEIYDRGVMAVTCLQKLAGLTGPGTPNPVPMILEALVGVLTQLQKMVKNDGDWKSLFLLLVEHLNTFNKQLQLLKLGDSAPDPNSALHQPIVQYSATLRELTVKVLTDAGFDLNEQLERSDWNQLKSFIKQYMQAGEVEKQIEEYRNQLSRAMDALLRELVVFSAVKGEETNVVVKEVHAELKEVYTTVQDINSKIMPIATTTRRKVIAKALPAVSPYFAGRKHELELMKSHLVEGTGSGRKIFTITGMGGCGKTQMVSYFLQETNRDRQLFTHVVFVDASSESTLKADLQLWVQSLGPTHEEDNWENALYTLTSELTSGDWVLIYDNADDPNLKMRKYFPTCQNGVIILTSRSRVVGSLQNTSHLELGSLNPMDALAALENAAHRQIPSPSKEMDDARILMEKLGNLPLALVHAGAYCHQQSSKRDDKVYHFTFSRYLDLFDKRREALLGKADVFTQEDYERGVYATLDLSYQVLQEASKQFLRIISHFHYSDIPLEMFRAAAQVRFEDPEIYLPRPEEHKKMLSLLTDLLCTNGEPDEFQILELIRDLHSFSLVSPSEDSLRMHPLVQAWARDMKSTDTENYQGISTRVVSSCSTDGNVYIYRYLLPHIKGWLAKKVGDDLHINDKVAFGKILDEIGHYALAETLFRKAIAEYGEETSDVLEIVSYLGRSIRNQGRWKEAEKLLEEVLEKFNRILGADHPSSITAAAHLAWTYRNQGRWNDAERLEEEVLEKRNGIMGADHPDSITAAAHLAWTYSSQGRWKDAERLQDEVLEKRNRILGADHPDSITAANNLASIYWNQGRWKDAERLQDEVLEKRNRILGADHPDSITAAAHLASTYWNQGRWKDAERLEDEVLEKRNRILGADHPDSITAANNLAWTYQSQGRLGDAERLLESVVEQSVKILGEQHSSTQQRVRRLVTICTKLAHHEKAREVEKYLL